MLLQESRRTAPEGDIVPLEDQDRSLWDRVMISEARTLIDRTLFSRRFGVYTIQAAIVAVHAAAPTAAEMNWGQKSTGCGRNSPQAERRSNVAGSRTNSAWWHVVPTVLGQMIGDPDPQRSKRVFQAMMKMKKLGINELKKAFGRN